jgi:hypothetical protein
MCCAATVALSGCGVGINCAPPGRLCNSTDGKTERFSGTPRIQRVLLECCDPEIAPEGTCSGFGEWWGDVVLEGTANRVVVSDWPQSTEEWTESHTLPLIERDPAGHWEIRFAEWSVADVSECSSFDACADQYVASGRSLVPCTNPLNRVRFVVEVYNGDAEPADCVSWGSVYPRPPDGCRDAVEDGVL